MNKTAQKKHRSPNKIKKPSSRRNFIIHEFQAKYSSNFNQEIIQRQTNCPCGGGCPNCIDDEFEAIQPKIKINAPNDKYEKEADQVADQVVQRLNVPGISSPLSNQPSLAGQISPLIQKQENKEERVVPDSLNNGLANNGLDLVTQLEATKGTGNLLPEDTRQQMEQSFGTNFGQVRIHNSGSSATMNKAINAQAFTHGRDIYFAEGKFQPRTIEGDRLLAHELTHVIQQKGVSKNNMYQLQRNLVSSDLSGLARRQYRGCSGNQHFELDVALMRAPLWVSHTISELESLLQPHDTITVAESALNRFFPPPQRRGRIGLRNTPRIIRRIIQNLRRLNRTLQTPRLFRCVSQRTCRRAFPRTRDVLGYAGPGTHVSLCPPFFDTDQTADDQILTLIHESAHRIGLMRNVIPRDRIMNLTLTQALTNAESYSALVNETFHGPPASGSARTPPTPLTTSWSTAFYRSEVVLQNPIQGTFYEGRGERSLLSARQQLLNDPFRTTDQKLRFRGRLNYYVDTREVRLPTGTSIPEVSVQILQDTTGSPSGVIELLNHDYTGAQYTGPQQPLRLPGSNHFDFWVSNSGRLRINLWFGLLDSMFDDTIYVETGAIF